MRIREAIQRDIVSGAYPEEERLPGLRTLAARYGCSRGTVSNALKTLEGQGVLRMEHGRGTFLGRFRGKKPPAAARMVGAVLLRDSWFEPMEKLRDDYLKRGWFVSLYCSSNDLQDPAAERHFLDLAAKQHFAGVILTGTPISPLNTGLYGALRRSGMKIIHLVHYKADMSGEPAILPDFRMAGAVACASAAVRGKKRILVIRQEDSCPPSTRLRQGGVSAMASALGVECLPEAALAFCDGDQTGEFGQLERILDTCGSLRDAAVLADNCAVLHAVGNYLDAAGLPAAERPFLLSMSDTHWRRSGMNCISFDYEKSVRMAMDYILDESIGPMEPFQRTLEPILRFLPDSSGKNFVKEIPIPSQKGK